MSTHEIDSLKEKSVLFISNNYRTLESTVGFLERRDVKIFHAQTLKEAVEIITQRKIDFVFLSVSLENTSPTKVIPILTHNFKLTTVAFAEKSERTARNILATLNHPHKVHPPMNGPKAVNKMSQIMRNVQNDSEKQDDKISVRSTKPRDESIHMNSKLESEDESIAVDSSIPQLPDDLIIQKGNRGHLYQAEMAVDPLDGSFTDAQDDEGEEHSATSGSSPHIPSRNKKAKSKPIGKVVNLGYESKRGEESVAPQVEHEMVEPSQSRRPEMEPAHLSPLLAAVETHAATEQNHRAPLVQEAKSAMTYESLAQPIASAFAASDHKSRICALTIKSGRFEGYLILGMREEGRVPLDLIHLIRKTLIEYLERQGETVDVENLGFELDINKIEFSSWAKEFADQIFVGEDPQDELHIAFISGEDAIPLVEVSDVLPDMYAVALKDIKAETRLNFDLYMHLAQNSRFIRYGRKGGLLTAEQLRRLRASGIIHFHLLGKHKQEFQAYCGEHFIRARLTDSKYVVRLSKVFKPVAI